MVYVLPRIVAAKLYIFPWQAPWLNYNLILQNFQKLLIIQYCAEPTHRPILCLLNSNNNMLFLTTGFPLVMVLLSIAIASSQEGGVNSYVHGDLWVKISWIKT